MQAFLGVYFEQLLTYGNAVGEMVLGGGQVAALYNASLDGVELEPKAPWRPRSPCGGGSETALPLSRAAAALRPGPGGGLHLGAPPCCGGCRLSARSC